MYEAEQAKMALSGLSRAGCETTAERLARQISMTEERLSELKELQQLLDSEPALKRALELMSRVGSY